MATPSHSNYRGEFAVDDSLTALTVADVYKNFQADACKSPATLLDSMVNCCAHRMTIPLLVADLDGKISVLHGFYRHVPLPGHLPLDYDDKVYANIGEVTSMNIGT